MNKDYLKALKSKNFKKKFLLDYGHLRPLTYSITSRNYKEGFQHYFSNKNIETVNILKKDLKIDKKLNNKISNIFKKEKLEINFEEFINLLKKSIEYRELSKFIFSKSINSIFEKLMQNPALSNITKKQSQNELAILVSDYIAGMTDRFALQTFEKFCQR